MTPLLVKVAVGLACLVIFSGLWLGPTSRLRNVAILFGLLGLAALLFAAIDYFHLTPP
jgi:hypothetical protein